MIILFIAYSGAAACLVFLFSKVFRLVERETQKNAPRQESREAFQSVVAGVLILPVAVLLSFFKLPLVFTAVLGLFLMVSGLLALKKRPRLKSSGRLIQDAFLGIGVFAFCLLIFALDLVQRPREQTNVEVQSKIETQRANRKHRKVTVSGYVRRGPSSKDRIQGYSIPGKTVKVLKYRSGFYYVEGEYRPKGRRNPKSRRGRFWIGGQLLD
jgi:hypothetical protein